MTGKIFLNYRRGDDPGFTRALYLRLEAEFTAQRLFMDVEGAIRPGDDFVDVLSHQVRLSDVVLVVIGPRWLEALRARSADEDDFVQIEIKAALNQGKRVIPVLVGGASMPPASALPEAIRGLARRNALEVRPERFTSDAQGLCASLHAVLNCESTRIAAEQTPSGAPQEPATIEPIAPNRFPKSEFPHQFSMPGPALRRALRKILFAMSTDKDRYYLNGFYICPTRDSRGSRSVHFVATDGHRLALVEVRDKARLEAMPGVIVPRDFAHGLYAFVENAMGSVDLAATATEMRVKIGARAMSSVPIQGTYPNYARIIPLEASGRVVVRVHELINALDWLAQTVAPADASVLLVPSHGQLTVKLTTKNAPAAESTLEARVEGSVSTVGVNARYAVDILQRIDVDEASLSFSRDDAPILIRGIGETDTLFVVMPLRPGARPSTQ